jgi:hypothetical protein
MEKTVAVQADKKGMVFGRMVHPPVLAARLQRMIENRTCCRMSNRFTFGAGRG